MSIFIVNHVIPFLPLELQLDPSLDDHQEKTEQGQGAGTTTASTSSKPKKTIRQTQLQNQFAQPSIVLLCCTKYLLYGCTPYQASKKPIGENFFGILQKTPTICYVRDLELCISRARTSLSCLSGMTFLRKLKISSIGVGRTLEDRDIAHLDNNNLCLLEELELPTGLRLTDKSLTILGCSTHLQSSLRVLKLKGLLDVTAEGYSHLGKLRNLRTLHLVECFLSNSLDTSGSAGEKAKRVLAFIKNDLKLLVDLKLQECTGLRDEQLLNIAFSPDQFLAHRLRRLSLANNNDLSGYGIACALFGWECWNNRNYNLKPSTCNNENQENSSNNNSDVSSSSSSWYTLRDLDLASNPAILPTHLGDDRKVEQFLSVLGDCFAGGEKGRKDHIDDNKNFQTQSSLRSIGLHGLRLKILPGYGPGGTINLTWSDSLVDFRFQNRVFIGNFFDKIASPMLSSLDLSMSHISDFIVFAICTSAAVNLQNLNLSRCELITGESLKFIIHRQRNTIQDYFAEDMMRKGQASAELSKFLKRENKRVAEDERNRSINLPEDRRLFSFIPSFTDRMEKLAGYFYNPIEVLNISGCQNIGTDGLKDFQLMEGLRELDISALDLSSNPRQMNEVVTLVKKSMKEKIREQNDNNNNDDERGRNNNNNSKKRVVEDEYCLKYLTIDNQANSTGLDEIRRFGKAGKLKLKIISVRAK